MSYRIRTLEQLTGLSRNTITAWERRYALLEPAKDHSGYRSYSDADVELLLRVKALLDGGRQISEVVEQVRSRPDAPPPLEVLRGQLLDRLMAFDGTGTDGLVARTAALSFRRRVDEVWLPIVREVGDRWGSESCSVAQEHFVSAYVRQELLGMLRAVEDGPRDGPRAICAGFPGEQHEIGLLSVAIHLALRGHRVVYLGPNLPTDELAATVERVPADLVGVSVIGDRDPAEIRSEADGLRARAPRSAVVAYGGPPVGTLAPGSSEGLWFCPTWDDYLRRAAVRSRGRDAG